MCLALVREGGILALRSRRRDRSQGEASRLREELLRLAPGAANGNGSLPLVVSGSDARAAAARHRDGRRLQREGPGPRRRERGRGGLAPGLVS